MASAAVEAEFAIVDVVGTMAVGAAASEPFLSLDRAAVAGLTWHIAMRAGQLEGKHLFDETRHVGSFLLENGAGYFPFYLARHAQHELDEKQLFELEPVARPGEFGLILREMGGSQRHAPIDQAILLANPFGQRFRDTKAVLLE